MVSTKTRPLVVRYGVAALAVFAALAAFSIPTLGKGMGSIAFLAILFSAWFGGLGPGLFATALMTGCAAILLGAGVAELPLYRVVGLVLFAAGGVTISFLVEALHAARRRAEGNQRWLSAVLTGIGDAVIATDAGGRVVFTNPVAQALTGWPQEEAAGRTLSEVFRTVPSRTHEPSNGHAARGTGDGTAADPADRTLLVARDGTERPIDDSAAPFRDNSGGISGTVIVFRDLTDRKRAEETLRASEGRFRFTADNAPVFIWLAGADKACQWVNKPWLDFVGRTIEQEQGDGWAQNLHPDDVSGCLESYRASFDARRPFTIEYRLKRKDGVYRWVLDQGTPLYGPGDEFTGYIGSCVDITERKTAEEELREADRRKDEFLAMLAHELRNPLSAISSAVQLAKRAPWVKGTEWTHEVLERQVQHLARLIDDLLDVSRVSRGKIQLREKVLDVAPVFAAAAATVRPLIDERKHELEVSLPADPLLVKADPTRLEQIVVNLLMNAAKYTESGGRIRLSADREGDTALISVRDNGVGIAPDQVSRMFELFAQGDRSLARSEGGLGIGLTLVRSLAEMHGGSVEARSDGPGRGSEFTVRMPAASGPVEPQRPVPAGREREGTCRILVVDDNADTVRGMCRLLAMLGHDVCSALNGPSAIEIARGHRPDYVLLDIGLPGMDGYQVARRLREAGHRDAVIIAVSGYGQDEDRRLSRDAGIDHHLVKPVDHDQLLSLLNGHDRGLTVPAPVNPRA